MSAAKFFHSASAFRGAKRMVLSLLTEVILISTMWGMLDAGGWVHWEKLVSSVVK